MELSIINRRCLLCGSTSHKTFYGDQFLVCCTGCGLVSTFLTPTETELKEYYDKYPFYEELSPLTIKRYNDILDTLEQFRNTNNLLETGCGYGFFLEEARKRNWNVYGTEYSEKSIEECKRKSIPVSETLEKIPDNLNHHFDVVVSLEVIEHLMNPVRETSKYAEILRPGGAIYITTPNFNSLSRRFFGKDWNVIIYPEHLFYFTAGSIKKLLNKNGFRKISSHTSGFSPGRFIYMLRGKKTEAKPDSLVHDYNKRDRIWSTSIEKNVALRLLKKIVNSLLSLFNCGDTLKVLYRKK